MDLTLGQFPISPIPAFHFGRIPRLGSGTSVFGLIKPGRFFIFKMEIGKRVVFDPFFGFA